MTLKNVADPVRVHAVELGPTPGVESVDPVCRMRVDHRTATAGYLRLVKPDGTHTVVLTEADGLQGSPRSQCAAALTTC